MIAEIAREQQWVCAAEKDILKGKIRLIKLILRLNQRRIDQVDCEALQACRIESKMKTYLNTTPSPSRMSW